MSGTRGQKMLWAAHAYFGDLKKAYPDRNIDLTDDELIALYHVMRQHENVIDRSAIHKIQHEIDELFLKSLQQVG